MKKLIFSSPLIGFLVLLCTNANAIVGAPAPNVPEIDGAVAAIALGLTAGILALIKEHHRKE